MHLNSRSCHSASNSSDTFYHHLRFVLGHPSLPISKWTSNCNTNTAPLNLLFHLRWWWTKYRVHNDGREAWTCKKLKQQQNATAKPVAACYSPFIKATHFPFLSRTPCKWPNENRAKELTCWRRWRRITHLPLWRHEEGLDREARQTRYCHPRIISKRTSNSLYLAYLHCAVIRHDNPPTALAMSISTDSLEAKINNMVVLKSPMTPSHFLTKVKNCNSGNVHTPPHAACTTSKCINNLIIHSNTAFQGLLFTIPLVELRYTIAHEQSSPSTDRTNFSQLDLREGRPHADVR